MFPPGFFHRSDPTPDDRFYAPVRLVTHIDDGAIAAVGALYAQLGIDGTAAPASRSVDAADGFHVLDLMSSWVSHFRAPPPRLTVLGMNARELDANPAATTRLVHDLNVDPLLPFPDGSFDAAVCCVSVDYLIEPVTVFREVARVLVPGGPFVVTFSNRCFPTKAIAGWLASDDAGHVAIVAAYFRAAGTWDEPVALRCPTPPGGDPLFAVWARSATDSTKGW